MYIGKIGVGGLGYCFCKFLNNADKKLQNSIK